MEARIQDVIAITANGYHNAFTALTKWQGYLWLGYRAAHSHGITPPGVVQIWRGSPGQIHDLSHHTTLALPGMDVRDPRFLATSHALYCFIGAYQPAPPATALSTDSAENLIRTYCTHTIDGETWTPLTPILRPNYWGWSAVEYATKHTASYFMASYHTGKHGETSSLALAVGRSPYRLVPYHVFYDGSQLDPEQAPHYSPSEPVLFAIDGQTMGCYVRTESTMDLGVAIHPYQHWRWHQTPYRIHPSAVLQTPIARLLVGRGQTTQSLRTNNETWTGLWVADAQYLRLLVRFPGIQDCAYPGIVQGQRPDELLVSYYAQEASHSTLPGANIYLATVRLHS